MLGRQSLLPAKQDPVTQSSRRTAPFLDPSDPRFSVRSEAVRAARAESWYARTPFGLAVLRYDEMKAMILHPSLRQGSHRWPEHNGAAGLWAAWWKRIMLNREGPDHARLRRLGQPAFAPRLVASMVPSFQALAGRLIDEITPRGRCEFMSEFAEPYAARVICLLIGLDDRHWRELADIATEMGLALGVTYAREEARIDAATERLFVHARAIIAERRAAPRDDYITALIEANETTDRLSDQELQDMIVLSIFGGIDTTRNQLGLALALFLENPDQWQALADRPELARQAVEEVMRLRPTTTWVTREAVEDFEFQGLAIAKGTTIHLFTQTSATDPAYFDEAFDITVKKKAHFGFGGGKHHCIGSPIARADMSEALRLLASRLADLRPDGAAEWLPDSGNTGPISLPIRYTARVAAA